ncbi:MAG: glycosyltransferase [Firmicutes bacterium]|nr:glycosyltransferase [Bacillota bacterium]
MMKDDHIFRLTDDTGMLQHSKYGVPDLAHGYTTDDNARALIMATMLYEKYRKKKYLDLIFRYSSFILNAQIKTGKFRNFMSYDRKWLEEEGSEDCFGRCLWAIGYALSNKYIPQGVRYTLLRVLKKALPNVVSLNWPRAKAYSIIGLASLNSEDTQNLVFDTASSLCRLYDEQKDEKWKWFEKSVTYSNSVFPWALFAAQKIFNEKRFLEVAEESLDFLESITFKDGFFKPVGCNGWLVKGGTPAEFDEQPIEACETALTYLEAYSVTRRKKYKAKAKKCHAWYEGANSKGIKLVDGETGGCFDGLTGRGVNQNLGAESLVSYWISYLALSDLD